LKGSIALLDSAKSSKNSQAAYQFLQSKFLWSAILVVGLVGGAVFLPYWRPAYWYASSQLAGTITLLRQNAEPVVFSDLRLSDETEYKTGDQVAIILKRFAKIPREVREIVDSATTLTQEQLDLLRKTLDENRQALVALAAVEGVEHCRFRYDFDVACPMDTILSSVDEVSKAFVLGRADFVQMVNDTNHSQAFEGVLELCDTTELLRNEPFLVSQHVRVRNGGQAIDCIEKLLAIVDVNNVQFQALDDRLMKMETNFRLAGVIRAERASLFTTMQNLSHPDVRKTLDSMVGLDTGGGLISFGLRKSSIRRWSSLAYSPELMAQQNWMIAQMNLAAELIDFPGKEMNEKWLRLDQEINSKLESEKDTPVSLLFPAIGALRDQAFAYRERLEATRLALHAALERVGDPNAQR